MKTIIAQGTHRLGSCDYTSTGKRNNLAEFEWSLKESPDGPVFSMSGSIWNHRKTDIHAGGQCCNEILEFFPNDHKAARLVKIWEQHHLNHLNPGTPEQDAELNRRTRPTGLDYYTWACDTLKAAGLYEVPLVPGMRCAGTFPRRSPERRTWLSVWRTLALPPDPAGDHRRTQSLNPERPEKMKTTKKRPIIMYSLSAPDTSHPLW